VRNKIPRWLLYEKYSQAKALALLDKMLSVNAVFAFTEKVNKTFPTLKEDIEKLGFQVVNHWHLKEPRKGFNEWKARGAWDRIVDPAKTYMNYDRHYVMLNEKVIPKDGTSVCWHIDHMSYNIFFYLEFLSLITGKEGSPRMFSSPKEV